MKKTLGRPQNEEDPGAEGEPSPTTDRSAERPQGLWNKMLWVMEHAGKLERTGTNSEHQYKYVEEAEVVAMLRPLMVRSGLVLMHDEKSCEQVERKGRNGPVSDVTRIRVEFTFVDADSGERFTFSEYGSGQDSLDKGPFKALTGAMKYALTKTFLLSTGDDPERSDPTNPAEQPREQAYRQEPQQQAAHKTQEKPEPLPAKLATVNLARKTASNPLLSSARQQEALTWLDQPHTEEQVLQCIAILGKEIERAEAEIEAELKGISD